MEIVKQAAKWGNGAGIVLPKNWIGKQVKIILIDRTEEIKEEVLDILKNDLKYLIGIYLVGSYSRGDEENNSDIDIIAISSNLKKEISSGKYNISTYPLSSVKKTIKSNPILIYPRLLEAKPIFNNSLLEELKKEKMGSIKKYLEEAKGIIKINEGIIKICKDEIPDSVIYSLVLRLRGILLIKKMKQKKILMKNEFLNYLKKNLGSEMDNILSSYNRIKLGKPEKEIVSMNTTVKLIKLLKKEIKNVK